MRRPAARLNLAMDRSEQDAGACSPKSPSACAVGDVLVIEKPACVSAA